MKKKLWMLLSLVLLTLSHNTWAATVVKATFDAGWPEYDGGKFKFSGNFVGEDLNNDGLLSFGEFSVFNWSSTYNSFTLSDLFDTGDINIDTQEWLNNGLSWVGRDNLAYITWADREQSINTNIKGEYRFTSFEVSAVPLPPAVLLFAPALLGFMGLRRKAKLAA
ncbi:hypothetical protein [Methylophaga sulfidovorans]|uniref:VPLPA-CTERM protein sorting domain-containing protein n=1 Tax=Methylophaga sulfidovorans TaxID=45496 RepID=A0A1I3U620_9GAMM|nr:hypothetical protein [Methylophaga sulfidovorans]SFJ77211.1 hypothetical protein SAMN04488079_101150 [Methylophaga sulfidovorans]